MPKPGVEARPGLVSQAPCATSCSCFCMVTTSSEPCWPVSRPSRRPQLTACHDIHCVSLYPRPQSTVKDEGFFHCTKLHLASLSLLSQRRGKTHLARMPRAISEPSCGYTTFLPSQPGVMAMDSDSHCSNHVVGGGPWRVSLMSMCRSHKPNPE